MTGIEIKNAVDKTVEELNPKDFDEAINWGDLECTEVKEVIFHYPAGVRYTMVTIEEAAPNCPNFSAEIAERFFSKYGLLIKVKTEW